MKDGIPVFVQQAVGVIVRTAIVFLLGWLAKHGGPTVSDSEVTTVVAAISGTVAVAAWGIWQRYKSRLKFVVAQTQANMTEEQVNAQVKNPLVPNPSVLTPKDQVPVMPKL